MKKFTLLIAACSMALMSYAAGGTITYELNGGVTNDYGWKNKADMLVGLNQDYNTQYSVATTATWYNWETLSVILSAADPVVRIPTFATNMWAVLKTPKWLWLHDYIVATVTKQSVAAIAEAENAYWRYNVSAFFVSGQRATWPASANYAVAGQPEAFIPTWKHAFAGPATYDGTTEVIIPAPYKEGFTFDGWYDNAAFTGSKITSIAVGADGNKALYAKWIEYIPTCAEVKALGAAKTTKAGGFVTLVSGTTAYIQDASAGLMIEFTEAPTLVVGDKITISGTTAALGSYLKVTGATLVAKEAGTAPTQQTVTLATLKGDVASYMHEYVYLEGLKVASYGTDNVVLVDDTESSITLLVSLNQATIPVNTKVNVKAVVTYDSELKLVTETSKVTISPVPRPDPSVYAPLEDGKYTLTSKWLVSKTLDNLSANPIGTAQMVRGMTAKDGKMYFIDRENKRINVVDGATGKKLVPIVLATNIFQHVGKSVSGADSIYLAGTLQYNDIKKDAAGNILIGNLISSVAQPFQVWKIDLATGNGTLLIDEILKDNPDFASATVRFDAFGVYGDVNTNGIIMAANASAMEAYKWKITNGVVGKAEQIIIDAITAGTFLTGLTNPGTAPQIFPMDDNYFYLDGNATLPTLIDMAGNVVDGFYNVPKTVEDWSIGIGNKQGHNGLIEFDLGGEHFFLMASMNTAGVPPSTFRLFKWANANKEFNAIKSFWTLPANGMGGTSNPYRTAIPMVETNESTKTATLYLYTGENGYGVYEFKINSSTGIDILKNNPVKISIVDRTVNFNKEVASVAVYTVAGQLVKKATNVSSVDLATNGLFLVKTTTHERETFTHKVVVK
ncbi:MAG TPA: InlB B-repeat-containing protein [Bacteroidales bacterium]|nr:InlB B-repeat-containing protein [Bacteroidales bacterium]